MIALPKINRPMVMWIKRLLSVTKLCRIWSLVRQLIGYYFAEIHDLCGTTQPIEWKVQTTVGPMAATCGG
jgi:hypothetical protein